MEVMNVCRCCLSQGLHKDLNSTYTWLNQKEIYSDMLQECYNISLPISQFSNLICDICIKMLRSSFYFKRQVLKSEEEFNKRIKEMQENDEKPLKVKLEPELDIEDGVSDDSDDHFLIDTARQMAAERIKSEPNETPTKKKAEHKRRTKTIKKKTEEMDPSKKFRTLITRLAGSMKPHEMTDVTTIKKSVISNMVKTKRTNIIIKKDKINLMWSTKTSHDKGKHRENLQTILKYSNATPFKNKSLLGFICGYCEATFPDPIDLRRHTEVDHKKERLNFKSTFDMTEYNVKLDVTDLSCTLCDNKMENLANLKDHLVKVHNKVIYDDIKDHMLQFKLKKGDVFDCAMCTSTYETFKMLKQHMNIHYSNYTCNKCDTAFATKRSLNAHQSTHQKGSFKCDHCDKVFPNKTKKHYHEKTKHLGARNISNCPYCNEPFRSYYQRNQHLVKVHNSEAQYKCNVCNKSYILKSLLMYHIKKSHLMEKNFQCSECDFRFFSKKALKAHMIKHTGERIYSCEVCHKAYARKYTLKEHMRIHNNDRRFRCDICEMSFVQKCSLKSHLLTNHGISMAASDITSS